MAQNITLMGASYSAVPAVTLPKTGGGTARFDDVSVTTATASDVTSGKVFLTSDGTITTGTSSGGGGSTNFVTGEFTVPAYSSSAKYDEVSIPYTGNGYPISAMVFVKNGVYNDTSTGQSTWYDGIKRYALGYWSMVKSNTTTPPDYSGTANDNATVVSIYKNSTSASNSYTRASVMGTGVFSTSNPATNYGFGAINFKGDVKTLRYAIANGSASSYGLYPQVTYVYQIVYSS